MGRILPISIEEEMKSAYLDYAMSVIIGRALPDARDGLKPVQRRILYAMGELGLLHNKPYKKSARVVGEVLGKYHPHGDAPVYEALVRMAQDFSMRYPLIDGQGNFGSMDGDPPAAMRYTEVRLAEIAEEFLKDLDKETVDFSPNFDGSFIEPVVLPTKVPNLLINGASGIAVGMATSIPPHNLSEVIEATIYLIDNPDADIDDLMKFVKGPDFPTGGIIVGKEEIKKAYTQGRGNIKIRGKIEKEEKGRRIQLVITEIPYQINKASLVEKISELINSGKLSEVSTVRDESNREGIRIVLELKSGEDPEIVKKKLFRMTQLETGFSIILLAIDNKEPKLLNLKSALELFIEHRKEVVTRRTEFDLNKAKEKAHILEGLKIAIENLDEVVDIIKNSKTPQEAKEKLIGRFDLTEKQAQAILDLRLQRLTGLEREKIEKDLSETLRLISELTEILNNKSKLLSVIKEELIEIKERFGDERKTQITEAAEEITLYEIIKPEDVVVTITNKGFIKRVSLNEYKGQKRGGKGKKALVMKGKDFVEHMYITSTHDTLMIFSNKGRVYGIKVYEIPEATRQARGKPIENLIKLEESEKITAIAHIKEDFSGSFLMVTRKGIIKKTSISDFKSVRRSGIIAINLSENDSLVSVVTISDSDKGLVIIGTRKAKAVMFEPDQVRSMGRSAKGVIGIRLKGDDEVVGMDIADPQGFVLTVTEKGYGKMTPVTEFRMSSRGSQGVIAHRITDKTGDLVDIKALKPNDEVVIITREGMAIRLSTDQIPETKRNAQGVRLIQSDSIVTAVSRIQEDE